MRRSAAFSWHFPHKKHKESQNMKNTVFLTSRISLLLVAFLALSSFGSVSRKCSQQGRQIKVSFVQMVREATKQYLDVNNAVKPGYEPFLGCVSGSDHGAVGIHSSTTSMATC
jgi:hypothetical protein